MFLATWAAAGMLTAQGMRRRLAHFVIPAAICTALLAVAAQNVVFRQNVSLEQGQTWVMYALLFAGWFRALFLQPPTKFWVGGEELRGDKRIWWLMLATISSYVVITTVPLFASWLRIAPLPSVWQYVFALIAAFAWAMVVRTVWRSRTFDWAADRMTVPRARKAKA
jgi:cation-transporting ATPase E